MDGFGKLLRFERLRKDWSESAREASAEARRAKTEAAADKKLNDRVVAAKTGIPVFSASQEGHQNKLVENTLTPGTSKWEEGRRVGEETHHEASHTSGAKARIREMSNPFRPKKEGVFANARVEHPKTGVHEHWFETGPREHVMSAAREWSERKMQGE